MNRKEHIEGKIITSKDLHRDMNRDRRKEGLSGLPAINSGHTSTNNLARYDKSWNSVPDFFMKMFRSKTAKDKIKTKEWLVMGSIVLLGVVFILWLTFRG